MNPSFLSVTRRGSSTDALVIILAFIALLSCKAQVMLLHFFGLKSVYSINDCVCPSHPVITLKRCLVAYVHIFVSLTEAVFAFHFLQSTR